MAEEAKAKSFSTKMSIFEGEGDDRKKTGETPEVAIPMPMWMQTTKAFEAHFKTEEKIEEKKDGYFSRGLTVPCQTHMRNSVSADNWNAKALIASLNTFKPSHGREKIDQVEKSRRDLEKLFNREVTREEVLAIQKANASK